MQKLSHNFWKALDEMIGCIIEIKYINSMIKTIRKREDIPTSNKQSSPISEASICSSDSQSCADSEGSWERGFGLIDCLMRQESNQIQQLNSQIRLLKSNNQYLQKDNQLLQNQIVFLKQKIAQLLSRQATTKDIDYAGEAIQSLHQQIEQFQAKISQKISVFAVRYANIKEQLVCLQQKLKKSPFENIPSSNTQQKYRLEIENTKLKVRVSQLQQNLDEMSIKYIQSFDWRPYLIPEFKQHSQTTQVHRRTKDEFRIDLGNLTHSPINHHPLFTFS